MAGQLAYYLVGTGSNEREHSRSESGFRFRVRPATFLAAGVREDVVSDHRGKERSLFPRKLRSLGGDRVLGASC